MYALGKYNIAHGLPGAHTQAERSFGLPFIDCLYASMEDLGQIGAVVETEI